MPDVAIIGAGFGGSVAAKRWTQAGYSVALFEMGERFHTAGVGDVNKLQQSQDTRYIDRVFRDYPEDYIVSDPKLVVAQGMGYGGGSLVYSGLHLRAPDSAFASGWPSGYTRANLDPYYTRVETNVGAAPGSKAFLFRRSSLFKRGAALAGVGTATAIPRAPGGCRFCGWCVPICKWDRKKSMPLNYLKDAEATGRLTVYTGYKVTDIEPVSGGYRLWMLSTRNRPGKFHMQDEGAYWDGQWYAMTVPRVVIAAGTMESPAILERSWYWWGLSFPMSNLGYGIDGQGDAVTGGMVPASTPTDTYKGAIMMAEVDKGDYVIEDMHGIPAGPTVKFPSTFASIGNKMWGLEYKRKFRDYGARMLGLAVIGKSPSGGNISVSSPGDSYVVQVSNTPFLPPVGALESARAIITALGGEIAKTPWDLRGASATVHPTGGCKMGASSTDGSVVSKRNLQVWGNPNLYVMDGSVIPSSTFRNPSNTILAIAEKAMDVILGVPGAPTW